MSLLTLWRCWEQRRQTCVHRPESAFAFIVDVFDLADNSASSLLPFRPLSILPFDGQIPFSACFFGVNFLHNSMFIICSSYNILTRRRHYQRIGSFVGFLFIIHVLSLPVTLLY